MFSGLVTLLIGRQNQYVYISDVHSPPRVVSACVPQGSALGPLIFLLYINVVHTTNLQLIHSAIDSTAMAQGTDFQDLCNTVIDDLSRIDMCLCANRLSLNIDKTQYMVFSNGWMMISPIKSEKASMHPPKLQNFKG